MKRYVMSSEQIANLVIVAKEEALAQHSINVERGPHWQKKLNDTIAKCKAIEVPEDATHFARKANVRDYDYPLPKECEIAECVIEEIPK